MTRTYFEWNGKTIWIHHTLRLAIDTLLYNVCLNPHGEWDALVCISGTRMVGTGKSTLAALIAAYWSFRTGVPYTIENDLYFNHKQFLRNASKKPKYHINHYDEARRGLASTKRFTPMQEMLLDYYNECRSLGHLNIVVLPDFFILNEEIAVARSEILINVVRQETPKIKKDLYGDGSDIPVVEWTRGTYILYNRERKDALYDEFKLKHRKNYFAVKGFIGDFGEFGILDKEKYLAAKKKALDDYAERVVSVESSNERKIQALIYKLVKYYVDKQYHMSDICTILIKSYGFDMQPRYIEQTYRRYAARNPDVEDENSDNVGENVRQNDSNA